MGLGAASSTEGALDKPPGPWGSVPLDRKRWILVTMSSPEHSSACVRENEHASQIGRRCVHIGIVLVSILTPQNR